MSTLHETKPQASTLPTLSLRADRAHTQSPGEDDQEQAARLDRDNPRWLIVWGTFSLEFLAFPLFCVPDGIVLCSRSAAELLRRMRQTEEIYGRSRDV